MATLPGVESGARTLGGRSSPVRSPRRARPSPRRGPASLLHALAVLTLVVVGAASPLAGQILQQVRTDNVQVVYPGPAFAYLLPHIAASAENALRFHRELYHYQPSETVTLFLEDFSDFGHGGANTVPVNFVNLGVAPFNYVYETTPAIDRLYWLPNHEVAHLVHHGSGAPIAISRSVEGLRRQGRARAEATAIRSSTTT